MHFFMTCRENVVGMDVCYVKGAAVNSENLIVWGLIWI